MKLISIFFLAVACVSGQKFNRNYPAQTRYQKHGVGISYGMRPERGGAGTCINHGWDCIPHNADSCIPNELVLNGWCDCYDCSDESYYTTRSAGAQPTKKYTRKIQDLLRRKW